jgi:formate-dependent nitrite reductase cytochrome c552 subunit
MDRTGVAAIISEPIRHEYGDRHRISEICFNCHAGSSTDFGTVVQDEKDNFEFALEALEAQLDLVSGYTFTSSYPYFSSTNWLSAGDTDTTGNTTGKNNLGAAFNFSLLHHESGAYVHNSRYVKRLLYDSLDWIDDGQMNYSVGATISIVCSADAAPDWCQGAMKYLLPIGSRWNGTYPDGYGIDAERP